MTTGLVSSSSLAVESAQIKAELDAAIREHKLPGMVAAIVNRSNEVAAAAGVRVRGYAEPVMVNDRFHLGSNTKAMSALVCAVLVQRGDLQWDTTLVDIAPELETLIKPTYRRVTLRQFLTHHSGFRRDVLGDPLVMQIKTTFRERFSGPPMQARSACLRYLVQQDSTGEHAFVYSPANYLIVARMAESALSDPWEAIMRRELFRPLGMETAGFSAPGASDRRDQPWGHASDGKPIAPDAPQADNPEIFAANGTVHCSMKDWAKFIRLHLTMGESHPEIVTKETFRALQTPVEPAKDQAAMAKAAPGALGYAMGWYVFPRRTLFHSGTNLRWHSQAIVLVDEGYAVLVACNQGGDAAERACLRVWQSLVQSLRETRKTGSP